MFRTQPNASKIAILHLVEHLKSRGAEWMDIQVMTPHMKAMGAELIPRDECPSSAAPESEAGAGSFFRFESGNFGSPLSKEMRTRPP